MPVSKRPADSELDEDEGQEKESDRTVSPLPSSSPSTGKRKRRRISHDTASASDPQELSDEADASTPLSDYGDDGQSEGEEAEVAATQALRDRKKRFSGKGNIPAECGVLEKVELVNFMCHSRMEYKLGPLINFICGKNGSGKSAILTAIIVCLGGKASTTNRGQSLKSFIKQGEEYALIACTLKNKGESAYLPDEFGDQIVVERQFTRLGTSGYKIKNERGRIVSTKKSELEAIMDHFSLQIDNPLNVLSQDQARTFISTSDPAQKYRFFMKGVQLEQLDQDYCLLEEQLSNIHIKLIKKREDIEILKEEKEKAKAKEDLAKKKDGLRAKLRELRRQLAWMQVKDQEDNRDAYIREIEQIDQKIAEAEAQVIELDEVYQASDDANQAALVARENAKAAVSSAEEELTEQKAVFNQAKREMSDAQGQGRNIVEGIKSYAKNIKKAEQEIEQEEQRLLEINGGGATARLRQLDEARELALQSKRTYDDHRATKQELIDAQKEAESEKTEKEEVKNAKKEDVSQQESRLEDLIKNQNSQNRGFMPNTEALIRAISQEKRFQQKPIGPLGKHVRLTRLEWSSILEKMFGGTLSGFLVFSKHDADILTDLGKRTKCDASVFIANRQSITPNEPDEKFDTVLRVLEIDDEFVKKLLIIQHNIEQILLIPDQNKATSEMYDGSRLLNVKGCFCFAPSSRRQGFLLKYTNSGGASQDPVAEYQKPPRMRTNIEASINNAKQILAELKDQLHVSETEFNTARQVVVRAEQAIVRHKRQERDLQIANQQADDEVDRLQNAIQEDSMESGKLEALKTHINEQEAEKALHEQMYKDHVVAQDKKKEQLRAAQASVGEKDEKVRQLRDTLQSSTDKATQTDRKRAHDLGEKNSAVARVDDAKADRSKVEDARDRVSEKVEDYTRQARQVSERVNLPPGVTSDSLSAKFEKLKKDYDTFQQQQLGGITAEEAAQACNVAHRNHKQGWKDYRNLEEVSDHLKQSLIKRRERWIKFRHMISVRAKATFVFLLSERSFRGRILTDHRNKLLDINVEPDITKRSGSGRNTKTLSGGEKSFSQICLLLSMWEAMGSPIRCLDEFDVFMDAVNRNMSVRMIIDAARDSISRQYILISPGSKSDIQRAPDVNVIELDKPERGQQTIVHY